PGVASATGLSTLNLSYNGMSMRIAEAVLSDYVGRNGKPQMLIAKVTCLAQSPLDLMADMKSYATVSQRLEDLAKEAHPRVPVAARLFHLPVFNNEILLRSPYYLRRPDQDWVNRHTITPQVAAEAAAARPWRIEVHEPNALA